MTEHRGHDHHHPHGAKERGAYMSIYLKAWLITFLIAGLELSGSILSGSFALLADVSHVFTDTIIGVAPISVEFFRHRTRLSAERIEQIGGFFVAALLLFIGLHVLEEAAEHLAGDEEHHVEGMLMFVFATLAALGNYVQHRLLSRVSPMHRHSAHSGFHFHILTDLVKNLILPLLALAILLGGSPAIDAWAGYAIGWLIIVRALLLALESIFGKKVTERVFHYLLDTVAR
jgi:cobalt-zinc-cadmium efflux system protein